MKSKLWIAHVALALSLAPVYAHAAFTCSGPISYFGLGTNGVVHVANGFGTWAICNLTSSLTQGSDTVTVDTCKAEYALLTTASQAGRRVIFYFTLGNWVVPNPLPYHLAYVDY